MSCSFEQGFLGREHFYAHSSSCFYAWWWSQRPLLAVVKAERAEHEGDPIALRLALEHKREQRSYCFVSPSAPVGPDEGLPDDGLGLAIMLRRLTRV
jgi:hypothetical protein